MGESEPPSNTWFLGSTGLSVQNGISIGSAVYAQFTADSPYTLSGYIFPTKAYIDNRKKIVKQQYLLYMSPQYGELWPTGG